MPRITGSTADPYVKDEIVAHLRRGLEATGLLDDFIGAPGSSFGRGGSSFKGGESASKSSFKSACARSFTRRGNSEQRQQAAAEKEAAHKRASLARVATSNALQRDAIACLESQALEQRSLRMREQKQDLMPLPIPR